MYAFTVRPSARLGAIVGAITAPALIAFFLLGQRLSGLAFAPFDVFDALARLLPGGIVTFGIDRLVDVLLFLGLGGDLDSSAKTAEHAFSVMFFAGMMSLFGAILFALMTRFMVSYSRVGRVSVGFGVLIGGGLVLLSAWINRSATAEPLLRALWSLLLMGGWGMVLGVTYQQFGTLASLNPAQAQVVVQQINRREFLIQVGGVSALLTAVGTGLAEFFYLESTPPAQSVAQEGEIPRDGKGNLLPNHADSLVPAPGTRREYTRVQDHYRIDVASVPPTIEGDTYKLNILGAIATPLQLSLADLRALPAQEAFITMSCISNPIGGGLISTTKWTGVSLQKVLALASPTTDATAIKLTGADGFDEYIDLTLINADERIMLTYDWDDAPLPQRNGFPLRVHIPDRYGMKQPKWITDIEVVTVKGEGYWVRRGWSQEALVNATSVIDTVATADVFMDNDTLFVPVGGIAWAGARGIQAVQVRVDEGEWQPARLRSPLSERTWVIWRYDWPFEAGDHRFEVRCIEQDGTPQVETVASVRPDGATGIHQKRAYLREGETTNG